MGTYLESTEQNEEVGGPTLRVLSRMKVWGTYLESTEQNEGWGTYLESTEQNEGLGDLDLALGPPLSRAFFVNSF